MVTPPKFYRGRICVTTTGPNGVDRTFESDFTQVKFHEIIGRYTLQYGPPIDYLMVGEKSHYQFHKRTAVHTSTLDLKFWEIEEKDMRKTPISVPNAPKEVPVHVPVYNAPPPPPPEPEPEKIQSLLNAKVIYKSS